MTDLDITRDGEMMVVQIEGATDAGSEFVDSYMPAEPSDLVVVDSGRIILPLAALDTFTAAAREHGLTFEETAIR